MKGIGKSRPMTEQDKINFSKGKKFTSEYQPNREHVKKGVKVAMDRRRFRATLWQVFTHSLDDTEQTKKVKEQVKKIFPNIDEKDITFAVSMFVNCLMEVQRTKDVGALERIFRMVGAIEEKTLVEVNNTIDTAPKKWDIDELKKVRKVLFDK